MHLIHELVHKLGHLAVWDPLSPETKVQRVIQEFLIVCPKVKADWDCRLRTNANNKFSVSEFSEVK